MLNPIQKAIRLFGVLAIVLVFGGCKWIKITFTPTDPKQGDRLVFEITAGDADELDRIEYTIGTNSGTINAVPATVDLNSCKSTGSYHTIVSVDATAFYDDGRTRSFSETIDLTTGKNSREDSDQTYVVYVADEGSNRTNEIRFAWANHFQDEFDAYTETQYHFSEPEFFTTQRNSYANSADLTLFFGHGNSHQYRAGPDGGDWVDFSTTTYGNMATCLSSGDAEYLVSGSCQLLSRNNFDGNDYKFYWQHENSTRMTTRPFSGLHQVLGFRTNHHYHYWHWGRWKSSSEDFFEAFARRLDSGDEVRDAWLTATGDELSFAHGENMTGVLYIGPSFNDQITTVRDDYIYGNSDYWITMEYWEED